MRRSDLSLLFGCPKFLANRPPHLRQDERRREACPRYLPHYQKTRYRSSIRANDPVRRDIRYWTASRNPRRVCPSQQSTWGFCNADISEYPRISACGFDQTTCSWEIRGTRTSTATAFCSAPRSRRSRSSRVISRACCAFRWLLPSSGIWGCLWRFALSYSSSLVTTCRRGNGPVRRDLKEIAVVRDDSNRSSSLARAWYVGRPEVFCTGDCSSAIASITSTIKFSPINRAAPIRRTRL